MKKFLISSGVVISFIIYGVFQRISANTPQTANKQTNQDVTNSTSNNNPNTNISYNYKDGTYTGDSVDGFYGTTQVQITVVNGKITDVKALKYSNDRGESRRINQQALPALKQEVISAQNANVDMVSGATDTSTSYIESLQSAINQAKS